MGALGGCLGLQETTGRGGGRRWERESSVGPRNWYGRLPWSGDTPAKGKTKTKTKTKQDRYHHTRQGEQPRIIG